MGPCQDGVLVSSLPLSLNTYLRLAALHHQPVQFRRHRAPESEVSASAGQSGAINHGGTRKFVSVR